MKYFKDCTTAEECKKLYRKLASKLHPDANPDRDTTAEFQEMQAEFEVVFENLKTWHVNKEGVRYEKATEETAEEFMDLINKLLKLAGIEIELCGSWIWVTGDTKSVKEELKALKFRFSKNKCAWYFHNEPYRKRSKRNMTLNDIRNMYGSKSFTREEEERLALA